VTGQPAGPRHASSDRAGWVGWAGVALGAVAILAGRLGGLLPFQTPYLRRLAAGMLQYLLATIAAGCIAWWVAGRVAGRVSPPAIRHRTVWAIMTLMMAVYSGGLAALSLVRHRALLTGVWDLGYYAQLTWQLAQGRLPHSSVWHDAPWGNHATFILVLAAPILRLFPDPATLLVFQSVLLSLGAVPAYLLGRRLWESRGAGLVAAGAYLLYPPLQFANLFDFHPDVLATPILLTAFALLFAGHTGWALVWAAMLLTVKEDMALVALTFGLYVTLAHRRPIGLLLTAGASLAFALLVWVVIPGWIQTPYFALFNRWPQLGSDPWQLLMSPWLRPAAFFGTLLHPERLGYLALLVTPLAGLPLLAPEILAIALPPLVSNLLSGAEAQHTIRAHYTATLTPVLIAAAVVGGRRAAGWLKGVPHPGRRTLAALAATSVASSLAFSPLPWSQDPFARKQFWNATARDGLPILAAHVPPGSSLSAANHLGAHFALRKTLRMFPTDRDAVDLVLVDVAGRDYVGAMPDTVAFRPLLRSIVATRPLLTVAGGLALFGRGAPSPDAAPRLFNLRRETAPGSRPAGSLSLVAADAAPSRVAPRESVQVRYRWAAAGDTTGTPCIGEAMAPPGGPPLWSRVRPAFHGLLHDDMWQIGQVADEAVVATVPETIPPGTYTWSVVTWQDRDGGSCGAPPPAAAPGVSVAQLSVLPW
jgi:uncharacterized membrane protein